MRVTIRQIREACDNAEIEGLREYSGRAMYGKKCAGITTGDAAVTMVNLVLALVNETAEYADSNSYEMFGTICTDDMGREQIVYFPTIEWEKDPDEKEESEEKSEDDDSTPSYFDTDEAPRFGA